MQQARERTSWPPSPQPPERWHGEWIPDQRNGLQRATGRKWMDLRFVGRHVHPRSMCKSSRLVKHTGAGAAHQDSFVVERHGGKRYREVVSILGAAQVRLGATHTARSLYSAAATSVISASGNVKRVPNRRTENVSIDVDPAWAAEGRAVVRHGLRERVGQPGGAAVVGSLAPPCVRGVRRGARGAGRTGLDSGRGRRTRNRLVPIAGRWGIGPPRSRRRVRRQIQVKLSGVVEAGDLPALARAVSMLQDMEGAARRADLRLASGVADVLERAIEPRARRLSGTVADIDRRLARLEGWIEGERAGRGAPERPPGEAG